MPHEHRPKSVTLLARWHIAASGSSCRHRPLLHLWRINFRQKRNVKKQLEEASQRKTCLAQSQHCSAGHNSQRNKRHFARCLVHNNKLHLNNRRPEFILKHVLVAGQMGTSLSSATLSWLPCKSGLQHRCSGSLKSRWENMRTSLSPHQNLSCWKDVATGLSQYSAGRVCPQSQAVTDLLPSSRKVLLSSLPERAEQKGCPRKPLFQLYKEFWHKGLIGKQKSMVRSIQVQSLFASQIGLPSWGPPFQVVHSWSVMGISGFFSLPVLTLVTCTS